MVAVSLADGVVERGLLHRKAVRQQGGIEGEDASDGGGDLAAHGRGAPERIGGCRRGVAVRPFVTFETRGSNERDGVPIAVAGQVGTDAVGGEVGIPIMALPDAVIGDKLEAHLLTCIFGEVEANVRPGTPADVVQGVESRDIRTGPHIVLRASAYLLAVFVEHAHHESGLIIGSVSRILQHHGELDQQHGMVWVNGELVGDGLRLRANEVVAEFHHGILAGWQQGQQISGIGIGALLGNQGVPPIDHTCMCEGIDEIAVVAGNARPCQVRKIRTLRPPGGENRQHQHGEKQGAFHFIEVMQRCTAAVETHGRASLQIP